MDSRAGQRSIVSLELHGEVAVITADNPPVNTITAAVLGGGLELGFIDAIIQADDPGAGAGPGTAARPVQQQ